jgi:hypothetical protein
MVPIVATVGFSLLRRPSGLERCGEPFHYLDLLRDRLLRSFLLLRMIEDRQEIAQPVRRLAGGAADVRDCLRDDRGAEIAAILAEGIKLIEGLPFGELARGDAPLKLRDGAPERKG